MLNTMALSIKTNSSQKSGSETIKSRIYAGLPETIIEITVTSKASGFKVLYAKSVILALGCRERTRGQIMIPGARPAGVFTAGLAQRMVNIEGYLPGREIVILGSGDIGLIMARRLTLEGCKVKGVFELMPFSTGLLRNISQCLEDYDIELYLSHTVTNILGGKRLEAVQVCRVDSTLRPILSSAKTIKCDTLLLSVGLIPENELAKTCGIILDKNTGGPVVDENFQTSVPGIFSCGNSLFVYDLVDNVTEDGYKAAENAALYLRALNCSKDTIGLKSVPADQREISADTGSVPNNMGAGITNFVTDAFNPKTNIKIAKKADINSAIKADINTRQNNSIDILPGENVAYAVPQKISGKKDVDFKIRAKVPLKNAILEFTGTAFKKKLKYINPGEMLFISVQSRVFENIFNDVGPASIKISTPPLHSDKEINPADPDFENSNALKPDIAKGVISNDNTPGESAPNYNKPDGFVSNNAVSKSITINIRGDGPA
jgi:thioredoxin reductase